MLVRSHKLSYNYYVVRYKHSFTKISIWGNPCNPGVQECRWLLYHRNGCIIYELFLPILAIIQILTLTKVLVVDMYLVPSRRITTHQKDYVLLGAFNLLSR